MMGWYHDGMGWGGWLLMTLAMVAFWALVVFAVVALFRDTEPRMDSRTPEQILDDRFARGEIDQIDYQARRNALHANHPGSQPAGTLRSP